MMFSVDTDDLFVFPAFSHQIYSQFWSISFQTSHRTWVIDGGEFDFAVDNVAC